jgi:O-antigen ligase
MSVDTINKEKIRNNLNRFFYLLLILLPASFPFYHSISSVLTIAIIFVWVLIGGYKNIFTAAKNKIVLLLILTFLIPLISVLYAHNREEGFFSIQKMLSLLIFPLILYTTKLDRKTTWSIAYSFIISCSIAAISSFAYAIYRNYSANSFATIIPELFGTTMSYQLLGISHVYLSLYVSFTIIIICYFLIVKEKHNYVSIFLIILIAFLLFFLFLLGGKMSIIALFLLALISCIAFIIKTQRWFVGALFFILPVSIFFVTIRNSQYVKDRFYALFNSTNYTIGNNSWNSIGSRVSILKCTIDNFKKNPILGTGVGDVQDDLDECTEGLEFTTLKGMNPHNQYFQYLLGTGAVGMIIFIGSLIYPFLLAYRDGNKLYLCFIFLVSLCFFTESLLERQHGVMFFAFFNSLFIFHSPEKE